MTALTRQQVEVALGLDQAYVVTAEPILTARGVAVLRRAVLRDAMLALHEVLADLEVDHANTCVSAEAANSPRQRRGLEKMAARYEHQLNALRQFFDLDVILGEVVP